jgi:glyoxylase-like metal-dependent hydrolase (beta-lactamase superfamily II)
MDVLAAGISFFDLTFQGNPRVIATAVLHGTRGIALIDPGPSSSLPALRRSLQAAGISIGDLTGIVLTHIHLDHAGATGTLVAENPRLKVYVHERGAPHLADPSKLLASASRLYGDDMDRLWGQVQPVPASAITALSGGERVEAGGRQLATAYTPGHASHHISYFCQDTGIAFVGDVAGIQLMPNAFILPPTPPPDIDLELWAASVARIEAWSPSLLFLTHFGPSSSPGPHLQRLLEHLNVLGGLARTSLEREEPDDRREAWFVEACRTEIRRRSSAADVNAYEVAAPFELNWRGLARYWRKRSL